MIQYIPVISNAVSEEEAAQIEPTALAFIGDCVHSIIVRTACIMDKKKSPHQLHLEVVSHICAKNQAFLTHLIQPYLSEIELDIFKRARNAKILTNSKSAEISEHRRASAFEAVLGYLYLCGNTSRIAYLLSKAEGKN